MYLVSKLYFGLDRASQLVSLARRSKLKGLGSHLGALLKQLFGRPFKSLFSSEESLVESRDFGRCLGSRSPA